MLRRFTFIVIFLLSVIAASSWWWLHRFEVSTDDAYTKADILPIMSRINGRISAINIADNVLVKKGQILLSVGNYSRH